MAVRMANLKAMREFRGSTGVVRGKSTPEYEASRRYNADILCQFHPDFYRMWSTHPPWPLMEAIMVYQERLSECREEVTLMKIDEFIKERDSQQAEERYTEKQMERIYGAGIETPNLALYATQDEKSDEARNLWCEFTKWQENEYLRVGLPTIIIREYRLAKEEGAIAAELLTREEMAQIIAATDFS
jgi:hypothetical protein